MNIPLDIINHNIPNKTITYGLPEDSYIYNNGILLYKLPYINDIYWTHFKYTQDQSINLEIELVLFTFDGYEYTITSADIRQQEKWYDTNWPIPPINTEKHTGIYLKIKSSNIKINITLFGIKEFYPSVENYIFVSHPNKYHYVFAKHEENTGSIYAVENYDYIRDIINKSCKVYQIKNNY
jgi:hypothetical protein